MQSAFSLSLKLTCLLLIHLFFYIRHTDENTFPEYEKKICDDFLFVLQLHRGKLKGINVIC